MPEPLIHFLIPFVVLGFCGVSLKKSLALSSLAILPDLDVLLHVHRSVTHSAVVLLLLLIPICLFIKVKYHHYFRDSLVGGLVVLSHPLLDVFGTYTPLLYPLYKNSIYVFCRLVTDMSELSSLDFFFEIKTAPTSFSPIAPNTEGVVFSGLGVTIGLVVLVGVVARWIGEKRRGMQ